MENSSHKPQKLLRHSLTFAMVCCFAAGGWLLLKPALRPSAAVASTGSAKPWTTKDIEDVKVGDLVLARDEHGAEIGWKPVKEVYRRTSKHLRHLTFCDASGKEQRFETTDEHPFWSVTAKKFVNAGDLNVGDQVTSAPPRQGNPDLDNPRAIQTLTSTHRDKHPNGITVYNFQVEDFHTYFVAARGATGPPVLVHNADYPIAGGGASVDNLTPGAKRAIQAFADKHQTPVTVVGSRARGTAGEYSDYDYLIGGKSRARQKARSDLPRGQSGGEIGAGGQFTGIDIWNANNVELDTSLPHIIFNPSPLP